VLAVCAHPDDESFGLGAVLASFATAGTATSVICLTHGEASTLGAGDLHRVRARELEAAAAVLGVRSVELLDHPDGGLPSVPLDRLADDVRRAIDQTRPDLVLVFDEGGITGHHDHRRDTEAALVAADACGLPVLAWALSAEAADRLNSELGTTFVGRRDDEVDGVVRVDRTVQRAAIATHLSQAQHNPVLERRLELAGDAERFRWLRTPPDEVVGAGTPA